jgi:hypothetical protein
MALNLLNQQNTSKIGIKAKRMKAGWDDVYLAKCLLIHDAFALGSWLDIQPLIDLI